MKLKNKILIITLIFVAIILFGKLDCFGYISDGTCTNTEKHAFLKDSFYNFIINSGYYNSDYMVFASQSKSDSSFCHFFYIPKDSYLKNNIHYQNDIINVKFYGESDSKYITGWLKEVNGNVEISNFLETTFNNDTSANNDLQIYLDDNYLYLFTNTDIYSDDSVFFSAVSLGETSLEVVLQEGYQTAQKITTQSITQQLGVLVPVGIVIMATLILVSLIAYFRFWRQ